jgi:UDP-N-acetylglucosamine 2-epimerase
VTHLPRKRFLALLKGSAVMVGNSSAGLIEAPAMKVPCVNIGPRQNGREKPGNVIDCECDRHAIAHAIEQAKRLDLRRMRHPYGRGDTGRRIAETLANVDLTALPLRKHNTY